MRPVKEDKSSSNAAGGPKSEQDVIDANLAVYEKVSNIYERLDSRRKSQKPTPWLDRLMVELKARREIPRGGATDVFLDLGAGSGFLTRSAAKVFQEVIAVDLSGKVLEKIEIPGVKKIVAEVTKVPLPGESVDYVGAFAVLHHIYAPKKLFEESYRLLKPGGILYSDHDISADFVNRWGWFRKLHQKLFGHEEQFLKACPELSRKDYELSEFHGDAGLSGEGLADELRSLGFEVLELRHHWEGMGIFHWVSVIPVVNLVLSRKGLGPVIRLIARKPIKK